MSFWSDVTGILGAEVSAGTGAVTDAEKATAVAGTFFSDLTDANTWRSLAWLALGVVLFGIGFLLLLRKPIEQGIGNVAKAVAL